MDPKHVPGLYIFLYCYCHSIFYFCINPIQGINLALYIVHCMESRVWTAGSLRIQTLAQAGLGFFYIQSWVRTCAPSRGTHTTVLCKDRCCPYRTLPFCLLFCLYCLHCLHCNVFLHALSLHCNLFYMFVFFTL